MPSKTKKQLNFFKLVKSYVDSGPEGLIDMWKETFPNRSMPKKENIQKIIDVADKINYADLEDLASGVEGDEVLGDKKEIKVGYWMKFEAWYASHQREKKKGVFIAKIKKIVPGIKLVNFNSEDIYSKNGGKIAPLKRTKITSTDNMWLDFAYFDQIKETAKNKNDLIMLKENKEHTFVSNYREELNLMADEDLAKEYENNFGVDYENVLNDIDEERDSVINDLVFQWKRSLRSRGELNEIRNIVRNCINEVMNESLEIQKRGSDEMVSVSTGMFVEKISDLSKGKILNVGVDDSVPAKNNINVYWYGGDLSGTKQTVYPEDIEAT
jgi:hypothetical protein